MKGAEARLLLDQFNAPVLCATFFGAIGCDRRERPETAGHHSPGIDPIPTCEPLRDCFRAGAVAAQSVKRTESISCKTSEDLMKTLVISMLMLGSGARISQVD